MNYAEYNNYGTVIRTSEGKIITYNLETEEQHALIESQLALNRNLYASSEINRILLLLFFLLIMLGYAICYIFLNNYVQYFKYILIFWLFCFIYFKLHFKHEYNKLNELNIRIKKEIPRKESKLL